MKNPLTPVAVWLPLALSFSAQADTAPTASSEPTPQTLGIVTITAGAPTSLPSEIPTTLAGLNAEQIARSVNATDSEDALKYFPSLLVRKRYIGDYNHAVLSSRASGTGNSARSAVYVDGILISNFLGNGASFAPRWAQVTTEEIERVDVMYGPFSAAYPGNSAGAIVDYVTRMPERFEAHLQTAGAAQPFHLYNTNETLLAHQESGSVGNRSGALAWWLNLNHTDSHGQPLTFPTRLITATTAGSAGTPVTGAVLGQDRSNNPQYILGTATEYRTMQDHGKLKLSYDFTPTLRASYALTVWQNDANSRPQSYLRDAAGNAMYSGAVNFGGRYTTLTASDFSLSNESFRQLAHGLSLKSHTLGQWDWEVAASLIDYQRDLQRIPTVPLPAAANNGAGTLTDQHGSGWDTLALKGIWRPQGLSGTHVFDFGLQQDQFRLRSLKTTLTGDWRTDTGGTLSTRVAGNTHMQSAFIQDAWALAPSWKTVLGLRAERWEADGGQTATLSSATSYTHRNSTYLSPKAALAWERTDDDVLRLSVGRAVRMPTVNELYGATSGVLTVVNDPMLRPEKSWTGELSYETQRGASHWRATGFHEVVRNSLYSERVAVGSTVVSRVTNVAKIATPGIELAVQTNDWLLHGLALQSSLTWADSRIKENAGYVTSPNDTLGKYQPRVPQWRASAEADYRWNQHWTMTVGARYSGQQYSTLDNSDPNGYAYQGASPYVVTDLRLRYQSSRRWHAALGIDNLGNYQYWNFHPYPRRSWLLQWGWDFMGPAQLL